MKKYLNIVVCFISLMMVLPGFASAQNDMPDNALIPTSAWLVGPASIAASIGNIAAKIPCVVANQYNDGTIMRFSGGNNSLMALAIDFKRSAFTPRQRYDVEISVPGQFFQVISGSAFDESTLIFNLQKVDGFYDAMRGADEMTLKVQQTALRFALIGLDDGFKRMEICYNPTIQGPDRLGPPVAPNLPPRASTQKQPPQNPLIAQEGRLTPMLGDEPQSTAPFAQDSDYTPPVAPVPDLLVKAQEAQRVAEELVRNNPQKQKPVEPAGQKMAAGWTESGQPRQGGSTDIMSNTGAGQETYVRREMRWRALKGANLREVLGLWAQGGGIKLIWVSPRDFAIKRSLSQQSTFEAAAQALLEQYSDADPRPVGRIYREPGTDKIVLVVELSQTR